MPTTEMIVMVAAFSALALSFINILRLIGTAIMHRTIRKAVERDPNAVQPLLATLTAPQEKSGDDRLSVILIAVGVAMVVASIVIGDPGIVHVGCAAAVFPLIIGTALWLRLFLIERARRRGAAQ